MPEQRKDNGQRSQERTNGRKHDTDFRCRVLGDQVCRQILEHIFKLARARSRVIFSAGHIRNLLERCFVNSSTEPTAAKLPATATELSAGTTAKLPASSTRLTAKRLVAYKLLAAIRKVRPIRRPKTDRVDSHATVDGLLRGIYRRWTCVAYPICE